MKPCVQCGEKFEPVSFRHSYCSPRCGDDFRSGKSPEHSIRRRVTGFAWDPVHRAAPTAVPAAKALKPRKVKTALILPDPQIGFRRTDDDTFEPFHDDSALAACLALASDLTLDKIVWLGDFLDLPAFGRYRQEPGFAQTTQRGVDAGYQWLARFRPLAQEMVLIEGNHDARLHNWIVDNAKAAAGLRVAGAAAPSWPVLTVPYLLRCDELGVEYVGGYPSGVHYLTDQLACIHGVVVKSSGQSTAAYLANREAVSVIFGHVHRRETHWHTSNARGRAVQVMAHSPGTLSRIDGAVPSVSSALDLRTGQRQRHWEDWQQGCTVVEYSEDGSFTIEPVAIDDGRLTYRGTHYGPCKL